MGQVSNCSRVSNSRSQPLDGGFVASAALCRRNARRFWRWIYAKTLYEDPAVTLDDLREAVTTLEDTERTARRVLGGAHPTTKNIEGALRVARAALRARETPSASA